MVRIRRVIASLLGASSLAACPDLPPRPDSIADVVVADAGGEVPAAAPTLDPGPGIYPPGQLVTVSTVDGGATLWITRDGSRPACGVGEVYTEPLVLSRSAVVRAIACAPGAAPSEVTRAAYVVPAGTAELVYDDGAPNDAHAPVRQPPGGEIGVRFALPSHPVAIERVAFYLAGPALKPTTDPTREFRVRLYRADGADGTPGTDLLGGEVVSAAASAGDRWFEVDLAARALIIDAGDVYVAMQWPVAPSGTANDERQHLAFDATDPDGRTWWRFVESDLWQRNEDLGFDPADAMIRAYITY